MHRWAHIAGAALDPCEENTYPNPWVLAHRVNNNFGEWADILALKRVRTEQHDGGREVHCA